MKKLMELIEAGCSDIEIAAKAKEMYQSGELSSRRLCLIRRLPSESPEPGQRSKRENQAPGFFLAIFDAVTVVMQ